MSYRPRNIRRVGRRIVAESANGRVYNVHIASCAWRASLWLRAAIRTDFGRRARMNID